MTLNNRNIFLFDGVGASVSALSTGLILPIFSEPLGLSLWSLYLLAAFPAIFMIYSLSCYFFAEKTQAWMLRTIILANSFYCLLSGGLLFFYEGIKAWGVFVLTLEILIVAIVIAIEISLYRSSFQRAE
jgi:hypothetical protein